MNESIGLTCLNCDESLSEVAVYCPNCGQKKRTRRASIIELLSDAFSNITNWDNAFWQTLKAICIPGKLTQEYFRGRRKNYITPVRLFLVSAVFFFAAFNLNYGDILTISVSESKDLKTLFQEVVYHSYYQDKLDSVIQVVKVVYPSSDAQLALDSTNNAFSTLLFSDSLELNDSVIDNFTVENVAGEKINLTLADLMHSPETFISKNNIEGFWKKTIIRQAMRFAQNPDSLLQFAAGQLTWMCLLMMPFMALILKLLYWRSQRYYVEHLVFAFHLQSFMFLLLTLTVIAIPATLTGTGWMSFWVFIFMYLYSIWAFYRFYQQGRVKTFVKYQVSILSYAFILSLSLTLTFLVSALIF